MLDRESFAHSAEQWIDNIYRFVYIQTGDPRRAENLTEQTFRLAWKSLPRAQNLSFPALLYRAARELLRSNGTKHPIPQDLPIIFKAIAELPEEGRVLLILTFVEELSPEEIAEVMGESVDWVKASQSYFLDLLPQQLKIHE